MILNTIIYKEKPYVFRTEVYLACICHLFQGDEAWGVAQVLEHYPEFSF